MRKALSVILFLLLALSASAQFKSEAFTQSYNDDKTNPNDSTDVLFSFKDYFQGLKHEKDITIGTMFIGAGRIRGGWKAGENLNWPLAPGR